MAYKNVTTTTTTTTIIIIIIIFISLDVEVGNCLFTDRAQNGPITTCVIALRSVPNVVTIALNYSRMQHNFE